MTYASHLLASHFPASHFPASPKTHKPVRACSCLHKNAYPLNEPTSFMAHPPYGALAAWCSQSCRLIQAAKLCPALKPSC